MAGQRQFTLLFPSWQVIFLATSSAPEASVHYFHSDIRERKAVSRNPIYKDGWVCQEQHELDVCVKFKVLYANLKNTSAIRMWNNQSKVSDKLQICLILLCRITDIASLQILCPSEICVLCIDSNND